MRYLEKISNIIGRVSSAFGYLALVGMALLLLVIFAEILLRTFFLFSLEFNITASMWLLVFLVWMGAAWTLKVDGHINVALITSRLPRKIQIWLTIFSAFLAVVCLGIFSWNAWELCLEHYATGATDQSVWHIPKWYAWVPFSLGATVLAFQFLSIILSSIVELQHRTRT